MSYSDELIKQVIFLLFSFFFLSFVLFYFVFTINFLSFRKFIYFAIIPELPWANQLFKHFLTKRGEPFT